MHGSDAWCVKRIGSLRPELVRDMMCLAWYEQCLRPMHQTLTHPVLDQNQFSETYCCDTIQDQTCLTPLRLELNGSAYEIGFKHTLTNKDREGSLCEMDHLTVRTIGGPRTGTHLDRAFAPSGTASGS